MDRTPRQLDLFATVPVARSGTRSRSIDPAALSDAALIAALPHADQAEAPALADECARRGLVAAIPALEELCRHFKGFGLRATVSEQRAALTGLRGIGGREAADAVVRLIADSTVQGPGLAYAVAAAAALGARLPEAAALACLRHPDPAVRAEACRCARPSREAVAVLLELLADLHPEVADAAACALGRAGRTEARAALVRCLIRTPTVEVVAAFAAVADDDGVVLLGRLPRSRPDLTDAVLGALDAIDTERAGLVAAAVRRRTNG